MKKALILIISFIVSMPYLLPAQQMAKKEQSAENRIAIGTSSELKPTQSQAKVEQLIAQILTQGHYRKVPLNDSLSAVILDKYLQELDFNRMYFLASDIAAFEKYRNTIDNDLKQGDLTPAYQIFNVFRNRFNDRMTYVSGILDQKFDFTKDESYDTNREKAPWATSEAELNEVWRKMIKSQALNLKLSGKKDEEIAKVLRDRFQNLSKAYSKMNSEDVFSAYINSFAGAVDPHTSYFSPAAADAFRIDMNNSLEGIGAQLRTDNDYTKVAEVIAGGPAFKSNLIKKDDRIVAVGQGERGEMVDVVGWRIDEVVKLIRGPKGTTVRLQVLPAEAGSSALPKEIKLVRDKIKIEEQAAKKEIIPVTYNKKIYRLGVITIPLFYMNFEAAQRGDKDYESTTRDVRRLIKELSAEKIDGLVIDLRNNGGGSLTEAVDLTGLFIPEGPVVQVRYANGNVDVNKDKDPSVAYTGPLAVLVNRFSASASEIFAGAIQDYKRGIVVGEQTYGKGTVQNLVDLSRFLPEEKDKLGQVKLTVAKFYRVTGSSTQHRGVTPDIELPSRFSAEEFGESSQPSALPWDQISSSNFKPLNNVPQPLVAKLESNYQKRLRTEPELKELRENIEDLKKARANTVISLQEAKRKKEREELEKKRAATNMESGNAEILEDEDTPDTSKNSKPKDFYLNETNRIMADLISSIG